MEKRKKSLSILLRDERKTESKIDLYSALEWPDAPGSGPNLCRVMVDGKWIIFNDEKYTFMTLDAAMNSVELSAWSLLGPCERDFRGWPAQAKPTISIGTPVRIQTGQIMIPILSRLCKWSKPLFGDIETGSGWRGIPFAKEILGSKI